MAKNISARKGNVKNKRSHSLRATLTKQNLNLQVVRDENGNKVRRSVKEIRTSKKKEKAA